MTKGRGGRAATFLAGAVALCLLAATNSSPNLRRRLIDGADGSALKGAWTRANSTSAAAFAGRIERSTARVLFRNLDSATASTGLRKALPRAESGLALRGAREGTLSASSGSFTRRRPASLSKAPAVTHKATVTARPGVQASAVLRDAQALESGRAQLLRKQLAGNAAPASRAAVGRAVQQAELSAGAARARAAEARVQELFYRRQQELGRLNALSRAQKAARPTGLYRHKFVVTERRRQKFADRHTFGGKETEGKSVFNPGEELDALLWRSEKLTPAPQTGGNFQRIVHAGRNIGVDRLTGRQTPFYTVITNRRNEFVTAFPGLPAPQPGH